MVSSDMPSTCHLYPAVTFVAVSPIEYEKLGLLRELHARHSTELFLNFTHFCVKADSDPEEHMKFGLSGR